MKIISIIVTLICFCLCSNSFATYYKYRDNKGRIHYTDNYLKIPEKYRSQINTYKSIKKSQDKIKDETDNKKQQIVESEKETIDEVIQNPDINKEKKSPAELKKQAKTFGKKKELLEEEYANLMRNKSRLEKEKDRIETPYDADIYKDKLIRFNKKVVEYEAKREEVQNQVDAYNKEIQQ